MDVILKSARQYSVTIQPKLILIFNDSKKMNYYENIFGGIYALTPVLISNIFSKEYIAASNIEISGRFPELNVAINSSFAIDFEKCTYCGECYKICPEKCISHNLEIDLQKCTYCNKCSDVCDENAINVSLFKEEEFQAPFVLTDVSEILEEYNHVNGIYDTSQTDEILSFTGEFLVEENILHNENICQYSGKLGYGCKRCLEACEHNALYVENNQINVEHLLCVSCGKCVSVCPTGAMQIADCNDYEFINQMKKKNIGNNSIFIFGNSQDLRKFKWTYSEIINDDFILFEHESHFFNLLHYLFLFSIGFSRVVVFSDKFSDNNQIKFANKLIEYLFKYPNFITDKIEISSIEKKFKNPLKIKYDKFSFSSRRDKLSDILKFLYESSEIENIQIEENFLNIFGEVLVDANKCSLCLSCVEHCKIGALSSDENSFSLNHNPSICIQCGICENVCPENAIELSPGLQLSNMFFIEKELCRDEPVTCPGCGKIFGSKKTFERVREKLIDAGLFEKKGKFLHYCEECRVKRIFEE
jgi:ferredoxin